MKKFYKPGIDVESVIGKASNFYQILPACQCGDFIKIYVMVLAVNYKTSPFVLKIGIKPIEYD